MDCVLLAYSFGAKKPSSSGLLYKRGRRVFLDVGGDPQLLLDFIHPIKNSCYLVELILVLPDIPFGVLLKPDSKHWRNTKSKV